LFVQEYHNSNPKASHSLNYKAHRLKDYHPLRSPDRAELDESAIDQEIQDLNFAHVIESPGYYVTIEGTNKLYRAVGYAPSYSHKQNRSRLEVKLTPPDQPWNVVRTAPEHKLIPVPDMGWRCFTTDPKTWKHSETFWCTKFDQAFRRYDQDKREFRKYEQPFRVSTIPFLLTPSEQIANQIYKKAGVNPTEDERAIGFWYCVMIYAEIPIVITEGAKKAASAMSAGYAAIGLAGIWGGVRALKDESGEKIGGHRLIPELEFFVKRGRSFAIAFDQDTKSKTVDAVNAATTITGKLIEDQGGFVSVANWDSKYKGIDDLHYHCGVDALHQAIADAKLLAKAIVDSWLDKIKEIEYQNWLINRRFTPNREIDPEPYLSTQQIPLPKINTITAIKSGLGTGKTTLIGEYIPQWVNQGLGAILLGYRNGLLYQTCEKWGFYHLHADQAFRFRSDRESLLACCLDSLKHFKPEDFKGRVLIIDEILSVIIHLIKSDTLKTKRNKTLEMFEAAIKNAALVVLMDAHLSDWAVKYIEQLRGDHPKNTIKYENICPALPLNIEMLCSTARIDEDGNEILDQHDLSAILSRIYATAEALQFSDPGQGMVITLDAQKKGAAIARNIEERFGIKCLRIDSETTQKGHKDYQMVMEFLADPLAYIEKYKPKVIIYSPSAESGLDINIKDYFIAQFCIFTGTIGTNSAIQMMLRIRDPKCPRIVFAVPYVLTKGHNELKSGRAAEILKTRQHLAYLISSDILDGKDPLQETAHQLIKDSKTNPHNLAEATITSDLNYESTCYRARFTERLESRGDHITKIEGAKKDQLAIDITRQTQHQIALEKSTAIYQAQNITDSQAQRIAASFTPTEQQQHEYQKWRLSKRLPGILSWQDFKPEFIKLVLFDKPHLINAIRRRHLLDRPELLKITTAKQWVRLLQSKGSPFYADLRKDHLLIKTLIGLNIPELIHYYDDDLSLDHPLIKKLAKKLETKSNRTILGISKLQKDSDQSIRTISAMLGNLFALKIEPVKRSGSDDDDRTREYRIDDGIELADPVKANIAIAKNLNSPNLIKVLKAIELAKAKNFITEATRLEVSFTTIDKNSDQILADANTSRTNTVSTDEAINLEFLNSQKSAPDHSPQPPPSMEMGHVQHLTDNRLNYLESFAGRNETRINDQKTTSHLVSINQSAPAQNSPHLEGVAVVPQQSQSCESNDVAIAPASPLAQIERAWQKAEITGLDKLRSRLTRLISSKVPPPKQTDSTLKILASRLNDEVLQANDLNSIEWRLIGNLGEKMPFDNALDIWCNLSLPAQKKITSMVVTDNVT
jgi:hypothetical protein